MNVSNAFHQRILSALKHFFPTLFAIDSINVPLTYNRQTLFQIWVMSSALFTTQKGCKMNRNLCFKAMNRHFSKRVLCRLEPNLFPLLSQLFLGSREAEHLSCKKSCVHFRDGCRFVSNVTPDVAQKTDDELQGNTHTHTFCHSSCA